MPGSGEVERNERPAVARGELPTIELLGAAAESSIALAGYVSAVCARLHDLGIVAEKVSVFASDPHRALSASMVLRVPSKGAVYGAGWHEELGWWVEGNRDGTLAAASVPCWLGVLLPAAYRAANLLHDAVTRGIGRPAAARALRYRFIDENSLLAELRRARR